MIENEGRSLLIQICSSILLAQDNRTLVEGVSLIIQLIGDGWFIAKKWKPAM